MRPYHKKGVTCLIILAIILFSYTFSFAQIESIKGVQFKDGSIIYGRVIKMNVYNVEIQTTDGKIISRKFDDVVNFIKDTDIDKKKDVKQVVSRFIDNGNGTITDTKAGFMWAARDNGSDIKWADAKSYCENYSGGGYTDWRMPTQDELEGLYKSKTNKIEVSGYWVWASGTRGSDAAFFSFNAGGRFWGLRSYDGRYRALPVRSGNQEVKQEVKQEIKQEVKQTPVAEKILQSENIRVDAKEERQVKKEIFNIAIGTERMSGNTTYQIGYPRTLPNGSQINGYFPFSQLEWPLDIWLARIDAGLNIADSWRINGVIKKNLNDPSDKMKDSDWVTDSNPGRLDIYSESDISKFDALIFDIDVEWIFLKRKSLSLYAGLGWQYQKFEYEAKLIHQYSPSGLPGYDVYGDGRVGITYEITYTIPYLKIGTDFQINNKFTLAGSFAWSPIVKAKDEDHHLLRENGGKIMTGDMDGNAYMINLSAKYKFTPSWFLKGGFHYTKIDVDGEQYQIYGNGVPIGTVREESESTQTSVYLTVGYTF